MPKLPEEVARESYFRAGFRCIDLLLQHARTKNVPVLVYSVAERVDLLEDLRKYPMHVHFLQKEPSATRLVQNLGSMLAATGYLPRPQLEYRDVFICHADEDKKEVVIPIVKALEQSDISVWFDQAEIGWGDSLIGRVQEGLRVSRYVIAVLSMASVTKPWPNRELNAALNMEASSGKIKVLPLIVGTEPEQRRVRENCSLQHDKAYLVWNGSPDEILRAIKKALKRS